MKHNKEKKEKSVVAMKAAPRAAVKLAAPKKLAPKVVKINHSICPVEIPSICNEGLSSEIVWKHEPESHDYPAAEDFLDLLFSKKKSHKITEKLKEANITHKKAKDILRASGLPLLPKENVHVKHNIDKVNEGEKLSPLLLVRNKNVLIIADGYHRVCAIYYLSEDYNIPCKLV